MVGGWGPRVLIDLVLLLYHCLEALILRWRGLRLLFYRSDLYYQQYQEDEPAKGCRIVSCCVATMFKERLSIVPLSVQHGCLQLCSSVSAS